MKIAIVTAGGAGMFCGSCMQDNTLARTLRLAGHDAVLVPTYTPIRVDEDNVSSDQVFLGGINVYLDSAVPGWRFLPRWATSWLNRPAIIGRLASLSSTDAKKLGSLTLDMLKGNAGPQRREYSDFSQWLANDLRPDVVLFSNALLSGVLPSLRKCYDGKVLCLLQGDDVFIDALPTKWRSKVLQQIQHNCQNFDGYLTHSEFYKDFMVGYFQLPADRFRCMPLSLQVEEPPGKLPTEAERFRIGYFARLCPEKGIHRLLKAAVPVLQQQEATELHIAGFLPGQHRQWFESQLAEAQSSVPERIHYHGSPASREEKLRLIRSFDLLCVPTEYREPKGLYVLEAAMMAVPSLVPDHGAFPELLKKLQAGQLFEATNDDDLREKLAAASRQSFAGDILPANVRTHFGMDQIASKVVTAIEQLVAESS